MGRWDDGKMYALNFTMGPSNVAYEIMKDTFFRLEESFTFGILGGYGTSSKAGSDDFPDETGSGDLLFGSGSARW